MTKPSNFIINTDYLTIAQIGELPEYTINYPSRAFPTSGSYLLEFYTDIDIPFAAVKGAIDRFCIDYNGTKVAGSQLYKTPAIVQYPDSSYGPEQHWMLTLFRKNATTITARCDFIPPIMSATVPSTPNLTFKISAVSFSPPNLF